MRAWKICRYLGQPLSDLGRRIVLGAAPRFSFVRVLVVAVFGAVLLGVAPSASSMVRVDGGVVSPVWAAALPAADKTMLSTQLFVRLREAGIATLVVQRPGWPAAAHSRLVGFAAKARTRLVEPVAAPRTKAQLAGLHARCTGSRALVDGCAVLAAGPDKARAWLTKGSVDFVVVRVGSAA